MDTDRLRAGRQIGTSEVNDTDYKAEVRRFVDSNEAEFLSISHAIHSKPELGLHEHRAVAHERHAVAHHLHHVVAGGQVAVRERAHEAAAQVVNGEVHVALAGQREGDARARIEGVGRVLRQLEAGRQRGRRQGGVHQQVHRHGDRRAGRGLCRDAPRGDRPSGGPGSPGRCTPAIPPLSVFPDEHPLGQIDGRRLAQLVSSPAERHLFRQERFQPKPHTLVSLLIDCSGSMKAHIEAVAVLVDIFVRASLQAGINTEVLGFTTGAWNGGRAQRDWLAQGRPAHPGRLNEVSYMVYKDAETGWRRARPAIAALLKPDLFREGVDGEAVDWACARMSGRDEQRRVLIVISDGCPMDTATNLANDAFYLDNHLKEVVARHERQADIDIFGLGVGLDRAQ